MITRFSIILMYIIAVTSIILVHADNKEYWYYESISSCNAGDSIYAYSIEEAMIDPDKVIGLWLSGYEEFPKEVFSLPNLRKLNVVNCSFSRFPVQVSRLKGLRFIEIAKMNYIPQGMGNFKHIITLGLTDSHVSEIPNEIYELKGLTHIFVKFCDPPGLKNFRFIKIAGFHAVKSSTIINSICNWQNLEYFGFSDVEIISLPDCITEFSHLREIEAYNIGLKGLPEQLIYSKSLRKLKISMSELTTLPKGLFTMDSLHSLILEKNQLPVAGWDSIIKASPIDTIEITQGKNHWKKP